VPSPLARDYGFFNPNHIQNQYAGFSASNHYVFSEGVMVIPVAGPKTNPPIRARKVRLHSPHGFRIYTWVAERHRVKPLLPAPVPQNDDEVLLHWEIVAGPPDIERGGRSHFYRVTGEYVFALLVPIFHDSGTFRMTGSPYDITPPSANLINPGDFTTQLQ